MIHVLVTQTPVKINGARDLLRFECYRVSYDLNEKFHGITPTRTRTRLDSLDRRPNLPGHEQELVTTHSVNDNNQIRGSGL